MKWKPGKTQGFLIVSGRCKPSRGKGGSATIAEGTARCARRSDGRHTGVGAGVESCRQGRGDFGPGDDLVGSAFRAAALRKAASASLVFCWASRALPRPVYAAAKLGWSSTALR